MGPISYQDKKRIVKTIPSFHDIRVLAMDVDRYPASILSIRRQAELRGYPDNVLDLLGLLSDQLVFHNRDDFIDFCLLVERLLKEEARQSIA